MRSGEGHIVRYCTLIYRVFFAHAVEVKDRSEHRPRLSLEDMYCLSTGQACKFGEMKIRLIKSVMSIPSTNKAARRATFLNL